MAHFGWTWHYLTWGIRWNTVQKMLIDAAWYDYKDKDEPVVTELTEDNAEAIMNYVNSLNK